MSPAKLEVAGARAESARSDPMQNSAAAAEALVMGTSLARARYEFHIEADPDASWLVARMELSEGLHQAYEANVELVSTEGDDPDELLGKACTLTIVRDDARRFVHGIVSRLAPGASSGARGSVSVLVVPAFAALTFRSNTRIFQDATVPEVLDTVLAAALSPYQRKHKSNLRRTPYPKREYIVQYRETDHEFVERLMAEEGLWYCFEQPAGTDKDAAELLVINDSNEDSLVAELGPEGDLLPLQLEQTGVAFWQAVIALGEERALGPTSVRVRDYNWTNPLVPEQKSLPSDEPGERPLYESHGVTLWDYKAAQKKFMKFDTADQARLRWEQLQTRVQRLVGRSNVLGLCPGQSVRIEGHSRAFDGAWLVVSLDAQGRDAKNLEQAVESLEDYANSFVLLRKDAPFRPVRRDKPHVHGIQTGMVVGADGKPEVAADGDDIHADEHGRIQVKLSWDSSAPGEQGATVTCFLRVAQLWGGNGWGFMFIPRIGMEVIVSFVDGDPDKPLVTGCVYNGFQRAPYELPAAKTKSYIKTQSSPGGGGFNELQFEDLKGKEEIFLHAQRNHREVVERDQTISVGADRAKTVSANETATIKQARTHTVHGAETLKVVDGSNRLVEVTGNDTKNVTKQRELEVTGSTKETYTGGRRQTVTTSDALEVLDGAHKNDHVTGQYNVKADEHFKIKQGSDELFMKDSFFVSSSGDVQLKNAGFHLHAKPGGKTTISVGSELAITVGRSSITMKADGTIEITGPTAAKLVAQGGSVEAAIQGVKASGQMATLEGMTMTQITGATVKIN